MSSVDDAVFGPALRRERERVARELARQREEGEWPARLEQMTRLVHAALVDSGLPPSDLGWSTTAEMQLTTESWRPTSGSLIITTAGVLLFDRLSPKLITQLGNYYRSPHAIAELPWSTADPSLKWKLDLWHLEVDPSDGVLATMRSESQDSIGMSTSTVPISGPLVRWYAELTQPD